MVHVTRYYMCQSRVEIEDYSTLAKNELRVVTPTKVQWVVYTVFARGTINTQ